MKKKIIFSALLLCWLVPAGALASPIYNQLVVFGDSLSDSGNNAVLFDQFGGGVRTPVPLTSSDLIPTAPYQSNRYSNGSVWVEQLADELGLSARASLLGGTNYAYGGARVGQPVSPALPPSLPSQVAQFLTGTGSKASSDNLYVIEGGGDDARDALAALAGGNSAAADQIIQDFTANMTSMITDLYTAGATDFLIWNVPDAGLSPAVKAQGQPASNLATFIAQTMNGFLDAALTPLEQSLPIDIFQFDAFSFIDNVVKDPQAFGLTNASFPCATSQACINNPDGYFFWDGIHPTTAGHGAIAQAVLQVLPHAVPEPGSLGLMVLGLLGIGWLGRCEGWSSSLRPIH